MINRRFFPLTAAELGNDFDVDRVLRFGCLPAVQSGGGADAVCIDLLEAYAEDYLSQEIRQEALVKSLDSFIRFLEVAALMNAQITNVAGIARDAAVAHPTVQGYFEILVDTLIGTWLPAWRPRAKVKEVGHPNFYFFDTGAVRALAGRLREPLEPPPAPRWTSCGPAERPRWGSRSRAQPAGGATAPLRSQRCTARSGSDGHSRSTSARGRYERDRFPCSR